MTRKESEACRPGAARGYSKRFQPSGRHGRGSSDFQGSWHAGWGSGCRHDANIGIKACWSCALLQCLFLSCILSIKSRVDASFVDKALDGREPSSLEELTFFVTGIWLRALSSAERGEVAGVDATRTNRQERMQISRRRRQQEQQQQQQEKEEEQ